MFQKLTTFLMMIFLSSSYAEISISSSDLSLEEKVGQLLMVHFHGSKINEEAKGLIEQAHVGSFIFYNWSNELSSPEQIQTLCKGLQDLNTIYSSIPLFISIDQEGGRVVRLKQGFSLFPSNLEIGETGQPELAYLAAQVTGKELKAVSLNMNLAPVIDVCSNPLSSVIRDRSYGSDPEIVKQFGEAAIRGYRTCQVIPVLKHFPGHGDALTDSHAQLPVIHKSREELNRVELYPFKSLLDQADAIMTAHLLVPSLDPNFPATLSHAILTGLLREKWGYKGLILSDSLIMEGISEKEIPIEEICLRALQAGCDILCLGGKLLNEESQDELSYKDFLHIHRYLVEAVKKGTLSENRIDESVDRILKMKNKYCSQASSPSVSHPELILSQIKLFRRLNHEISLDHLQLIADWIWYNECKFSEEKLLFWNPSEPFLSLGIGHFIWYPKDLDAIYDEGFPSYLSYMKKKGHPMPKWLEEIPSCPWKNREDFLEQRTTEQFRELHRWIVQTKAQQASFMLERLQMALFSMIQQTTPSLQNTLVQTVLSLSRTPDGLYTLVDYLNFKGSGLHAKERYNQRGWGLFQVLTEMSQDESIPVVDRFIEKASELLMQRTKNAPQEKDETRFLNGWIERLRTYKKYSLATSQEPKLKKEKIE